jgi:hypothetical protein
MEWTDALLLNALPALVVLSILVVLFPSLRRRGSWRGIGAAWLAAVVTGLLVAVTHVDEWGLSCNGLPRIPGYYIPTNEPCTGTSGLPLWLSALPLLVGIAVLLAWVLRNIRPAPAALRTIVVLAGFTAAILLLGQLNPNAALLLILALAVATFAWPRLQEERRSLKA